MIEKQVFLQFDLGMYRRWRRLRRDPSFPLREHLRRDRYPLRLVRYWQACCALRRFEQKLGRRMDLLDLGCERGLLKMLAPPDLDARWIGLDWNLSRPSLEGSGYDELHEANFDQVLPLADNSVDVVVCQHVFEHLPRPGFTINEIARVLRPGGILLLGAPVLPRILCAARERHYQDEIARGKRKAGRHINRFWPERAWLLCAEHGLAVEWLTGAHLFRWSGIGLESKRWWVRLNYWWGGMFPSLGREFYLQARKPLAS